MKDTRLFLIDGHALVFKMYYAFLRRPMINSKGQDTSILFGFTKYLLELIDREKPTHLAVAFDPPGGSFRNELYPAYKANRAETPQLVIDALEPLTQLCEAMNIPVLMIKGYEADDVIGSMAKRSAAEGLDVYMVTPDKDYGQLIDDHIFQYKSGKSGEWTEVLGKAEICEKYGICTPSQVIDMLAICGDAADNVPGVLGVGEVGASKLIAQYGSLEEIYAHFAELTDRLQILFAKAKDHIALSKKLVTIKTDIPLDDVTAEDMKLDMEFKPEIADLFDEYEFQSLRKYISHIRAVPPTAGEKLSVKVISAQEIVLRVCTCGKFSFMVESREAQGKTGAGDVIVATFGKEGECYAAQGTVKDFKRILEDPVLTKFGCDIKRQINLLAAEGVSLGSKLMDIELIHYLLNPERSHNIESLSRAYLGVNLDEEPAPKQEVSLFDEEPEIKKGKGAEATTVASAILLVGIKVWADLQEAGYASLYEEMEEPLIGVLSRMERTGVKVDVASLEEYAASLRETISFNERIVREIADNPSLNVSSPKQIGELIFEQLKLDPKAKKGSKSSWSTDEETLRKLSDRSPVIEAILEYRAAKKLLSTYIEPFPGFISPKTGRIHTTFNQALTATGRLSSSNPNLQNIPVRTEKGRQIRKAFVAEGEESFIMSADYSQIELRLMAHLSGDPQMVKAFKAGVDVHSVTASKIYSVPLEEVTPEMRRVAKTANFGIMYGISAFGLAERLGVSRQEAKKIIDDYFASFPTISEFIANTLESVREKGYVETMFGRRRYIPEILSHNANVRALAERNAVNAPIQGTAADIIKMAMINVDKKMRESGFKAKMVLQIHDELLFEVPAEELESLKELVISEMENVVKLSVPLTVECNYGKNWLEAH